MRNSNGFTLIELIASIALILVLFIVAVPVSTNLIQKSNEKHCETLIDDLLTNAELYAIDNNIKTNNEEIYFDKLYSDGYIEDEYDFKNGYIMNISNMSNNYITISKITDPNDNTKRYNTYSITINGKTGKENICK